jgi:capsular polysaccharide biosynthesis protein
MSLLLIITRIWKYKLVTIPIIVLMLVGAYYVVAVTAPTYEASATYILVNPPPPPTEEEIARNPALGRINDDNPYLRFGDQSVLVQVLAGKLSSEENRLVLKKQGADPNYTAQPSADFGFSAPILQITGTGPSAAASVHTANLVGQALNRELANMQRFRGVAKEYRITTEAVVPAVDAKLRPSGKLRMLIAVLVLGTVLLFLSMSVLDALSVLRQQWLERRIEEDDDGFEDDGRTSGEARPGRVKRLRRSPERSPERARGVSGA